MTTTKHPILTRRSATRRLTAAMFAAAGALAACGDPADVTSPDRSAPASITLATSVIASQAALVQLRVQTGYLRQGGTTIDLGTQTLTIAEVPRQEVPVSVDLGSCLADASRAGVTGTNGVVAAPAADECIVRLQVDLVLDGVAVDRQIVGPLSLRPGTVTTVARSITLSDIKEVQLTAPPVNVVAPGQPLRLEVARTMVLSARILDGAQRVVTGRSPNWSSSRPGVATVSAAGVVTAIAPGATQITAEVAGRIGLVDVRVVPPPQLLTIQSGGFSGTGTVRSQPAGIDCTVSGTVVTGNCSAAFAGDIQVGLTAAPGTGTELAGWAGDCSGTPGTVCTIATDRPRTVGVVFRALRVLTISAAGTGAGVVTVDQGNLTCVAQNGTTIGSCTGTFMEGAIVTLTAVSSGQSSFTRWTGDCAGSPGNSCRLIMTASRTAIARFDAPTAVSVNGVGVGSGLVVSSPAGLSCNLQGTAGRGACVALFTGGTLITLTATPAAQHAFRRWGGECANTTGATCTLLISGSGQTVSVFFDLPSSLTLNLSGTGDGAVVAGSTINCTRINGANSGRCRAEVQSGARLTLTALPDGQSEFTGWTGACSGTALCETTVDQALTVGAVFTRRQVPLALALTGPNFGSVRVNETTTCSLAAGESSRTCIVPVDIGRVTQLVASPGANQQFAAFTGACASSTNSCQFTVNGPVSVTARFGTPSSLVSVSPAALSTGNGFVYTNNESLGCSMASTQIIPGSRCSTSVATNSSVTLNAVADAGYAFAGWGGACAAFGVASSCTLTVAGDVIVTARFAVQTSVTVAVSLTGVGSGTLTATGSTFSRQCNRPVSANSTTVCSWSVPQGESFTVSIAGAGGSVGAFTSFTNQLCYMSSGPCAVAPLSAGNALSVNFFFP